MPFAAGLSEHPLPTHAVGEVVGQVLDKIGPRPDAAILFVTTPFLGAIEDIAGTVRQLLHPGAFVGVTASSVLGGGQELEDRGALALFAIKGDGRGLPRPSAVRLGARRTPDGTHITGTHDLQVPGSTLVLLADPYSFPVDGFVDALAHEAPGVTVIGGLASAGQAPGGNRLVIDAEITNHGAVGLLLPPGYASGVVVSQGCRPVGEPLVVTRSSGNLIEEIAGRPALDRLMEQAEAASPADRNLMARGLHIGLVIDENKPSFDRGDFLIRGVLGADHQRRAVAIGADVEVGSTVQFQVRDAESADEDLRHLLQGVDGTAALVFTCNGRGLHLFDEPDHDAALVHEHISGGASAGMFCAGEIGPVGDKPFVHGFTASVLLLAD